MTATDVSLSETVFRTITVVDDGGTHSGRCGCIHVEPIGRDDVGALVLLGVTR
jgi:hypothetical protein